MRRWRDKYNYESGWRLRCSLLRLFNVVLFLLAFVISSSRVRFYQPLLCDLLELLVRMPFLLRTRFCTHSLIPPTTLSPLDLPRCRSALQLVQHFIGIARTCLLRVSLLDVHLLPLSLRKRRLCHDSLPLQYHSAASLMRSTFPGRCLV